MNPSKLFVWAFSLILFMGGNQINRVHNLVWPFLWTGIATAQQPNNARPMLLQSDFASADCSGPSPAGYTRIFLADRQDGKPGAGSPSDPFDGSTPEKFDTVLRGRSESGVTHLIVCIGPGTFQTEGTRDFVIGQGHLDKSHPAGFTVNQGWRIHGAGLEKTTLILTNLFMDPSTGKYLKGVLIATYTLDTSGLEISDMTLDDNYPMLKARYHADLQLQALFLRSNHGHQWVHDLHVMNVSGEQSEDFPIEISSLAPTTSDSQGNLVEHVTLDHFASGHCTAIVLANSEGEVRNNKVTGYHIGYGGWSMANVNFHDNQAIETTFGFNVDSWKNSGIIIAHNQVIHPLSYGIVVGGKGNFPNFTISDNTVTITTDGKSSVYGLIFQGNVSGARVFRNKIVADRSTGASNVFGFFEKGTQNVNNTFQENVMTGSFLNALQGPECVYGNVDEKGKELRTLRSTQKTPCPAHE
jgi:hypothetical protein